jgi:F420-dependent oxidoreductase-like protein
MKLSVSVTNYSWDDRLRDRLASLAGFLDDTAVDTLWVPDHLLQADPASRHDEPMLEAYTVLGYLAGATSRIRLGTMVTAATFRAPALLIKAVTTLDVLSAGRAWLGIGAGYNGDEARAMGLFLPETAERFARMTDLLRLARHMWNGDESPFRGEYLDLEHPVGSPRPVTTPQPPVLIGGTGERRTLRLVAEYADACNLFDIPDGGRSIRRQLDVLARHCADVGRRFEDIERTVTTSLEPGESSGRLAEHCQNLGESGIQHVVVIARGRPLSDDDLDAVAGAANELRGDLAPMSRRTAAQSEPALAGGVESRAESGDGADDV